MVIKDEHKITRQGKEYVLFAGLLDEAHSRFQHLRIDTELIQVEPPIVKAMAEGRNDDGVRFTSGHGTGNREDDKPNQPGSKAPVEMAETRAKARALRDLINVGGTAFEELGTDGDPQPQSTTRSKPQNPAPKPRQEASPTPTTSKNSGPSSEVPPEATQKQESALQATRQQIGQLTKLMQLRAKQTGQSKKEIEDGFVEYIGFPVKDLSRGEADKYIETFQNRIEAHEEQQEAS